MTLHLFTKQGTAGFCGLLRPFCLMKYLVNPAWLLIPLSLALTATGWLLKLTGYQRADGCIMVGTGLVLLYGTLALWELIRWLDPGLYRPFAILAAGLLVSLLATANLATHVASALDLAGGILAAGGVTWLLVRLNRTLDRPSSSRRKHPV